MNKNVSDEIRKRLKEIQPMWRIARPRQQDDGTTRDIMAESFGMAVFEDDGTFTPVWRNMADIEEEPVDWLWKDHFPLGMVSLMVGEQGSGKTYIALDMAARVSRGLSWPDGRGNAPRGNVILLSAEDHPRKTLKRRLRLAGADCSKIKLFQAVEMTIPDTRDRKIIMFDVGRNLVSLDLLLLANLPCPLVILDPITAFMGDADQNKTETVRQALGGLVALAARHNTCVLGITHMNKSVGLKTLHRTLGNTSFSAMARCIWQVSRPEKGNKLPSFTWQKSNIGPKIDGMYFDIQDDHVIWGNECTKSADAVSQQDLRKRNSNARDAAKEWLVALLADGRLHSGVLADGISAGYAKKTMQRILHDTDICQRLVIQRGIYYKRVAP